ncbi:MAG TPA: glutamate racemase [Actinomycetota bacterium]|nr:glutamate racemase [Actinomycetota bacterium]
MSDSRPIGVFDSGLGGLTVVRAIMDELPQESILYFGDQARFPYGPRPLEEIREFALQIAGHLMDQDVKMIVIACNAATSAALPDVAEAVPVPVIGVVEPAVRAALHATRNRHVGLIGTEATVRSGSYEQALGRLDPTRTITLTSQACPRFVEFVERGDTTSSELLDVAREYLHPLQDAGVDTLILGCTHYPLLRGAIHRVMGPDVLIISSAEETANDVYDVMAERELRAPAANVPIHRFESSGEPEVFSVLGRRFLGPEFRDAVRVSLVGAARDSAWT